MWQTATVTKVGLVSNVLRWGLLKSKLTAVAITTFWQLKDQLKALQIIFCIFNYFIEF